MEQNKEKSIDELLSRLDGLEKQINETNTKNQQLIEENKSLKEKLTHYRVDALTKQVDTKTEKVEDEEVQLDIEF